MKMAEWLKWQEVNKIALSLYALGGIGILGLFSLLFSLAGVSYTFSGDTVCNGLECPAYINVSTSYWAICFEHSSKPDIVYKKVSTSRTLWVNLNNVDSVIKTSPPDIPVKWYVATNRIAYMDHEDDVSKWREIKDGDCWNRGTVNKNKLIAYPEDGQVIKWDFNINFDSYLANDIDIDPLWVSYKYMFKQGYIKVPEYNEVIKDIEYDVYTDKVVEVPKECGTNKTTGKEYCIDAYSYTIQEFLGKEIRQETKQQFVGFKDIAYDTDERIGVNIGGKEYMGNVNVDKDVLSEWSVPIGDRNFIEFGKCRDYEIEKGVCQVTDILGTIKK